MSIGTPVYNGEKYLAEALESTLSQTFENYELLISDNASTDGTENICREYCRRDRRIRYYRNASNIGASKNYRRVFELSKGMYFRWANCDDLFAPKSLARCVTVLDTQPSVVLAYPKTKLIDERGKCIGEYEDNLNLQSPSPSIRFAQACRRTGIVNVIYGLIRSDVLRKTALLGDFIASDKPLVAELSLYGQFVEIPEFLFYRRIHPDAYSSQTDLKKLAEFYKPTDKSRITMTNCRHLWEAFLAVRRCPLDRSEKIKLYNHVVRMLRWHRSEITRELLSAARQAIRSA